MTDVSRALILPDLSTPSPLVIANMALYWEEVVVTEYGDAWHHAVDPRLVEAGFVRTLDRELSYETIFPPGANESANEDLKGFLIRRDEGGRFVEIEGVRDDAGLVGSRLTGPFKDCTDEQLEALAAISLAEQLGQLDDSLAIAASNNFAPISHSIGGHLAAVIGSSGSTVGGTSSREAALLSVTADAFTLDPSITVEDLLAFRERSARARARFRASLVDLSEQLRADGPPGSLLSEAADTFKNRVEPALGDLEDALKESGIKFLLKSLVGATAIAVAPIEPISTSVGAAKVVGQTIDYSYSKSRLVRDHPYGYLHELSNVLTSRMDHSGRTGFEAAILAPRETLWNLWLNAWTEGREGARAEARAADGS
jgi:hypothetical protein